MRTRVAAFLGLSLLVPLAAKAQTGTATVTAGTTRLAVAVNPITDKIYVANQGSNSLTVIDGATNTVDATVGLVGGSPTAVAVNPVTNQIFFTTSSSLGGTLNVIGGVSNSVGVTASMGTTPSAIAVNPDDLLPEN